MLRKKTIILSFLVFLLTGCNFNFLSTSSKDSLINNNSSMFNSNSYSSTSLSKNSQESSSYTTTVKPVTNYLIIKNLDEEYKVRIHSDIFELSNIPNYELEDREILGWYFDSLYMVPVEAGVKYFIEGNLDIYAKVKYNANYYVKDFLINSVSSIYINTENNKVVNTKEEYTNATFKIVDNKVEEYNFPQTNIRIKCRGNSSYWNAHLQGEPFENSKFSYKIKFDEKQNLFNFGKDKEWNLVANFMDRSFIRNHLVYSLSKLMTGLEFTIDHQYVELYINNDYKGLYMLTESVKTGSNRVDIEQDYTSQTKEIPFMLEQDAKALEDGSIENIDYFWSNGLPFSTKYPDDLTTASITTEQFNYIKYELNELYASVNSSTKYKNHLDMNSFIDYFMVQEIFRNVDVNHSSVYLYKRPGEVFKMGPIWDLDLSIGNYDYIPSHPEQFLKSLVGGGGNYLYNNLMRHDEFKDAYIARFKFVKEIYMEALRLALPEITNMLKPYAERDYAKWKTLNHNVDCLANNPDLVAITRFEDHIKYIENYMFNGIGHYQGRLNWLNTYLQNY